MKLSRTEFIKRVVQVVLAGILTIVAIALGKRTVAVNDCNICPGNGICSGDVDCSKFLAEKQ